MRIRFLHCLLCLISGLFCWEQSIGQNTTHRQGALSLYFDNYSVTNGLSGNIITCIYRDKRGFLWVGTTEGLNKFDGRDVKVYTHNRNNSHSISNNYIQSIAEDNNGNIWLGTKNGICKFNPYNEKADNFYHNPDNPFSLKGDQDNYVYIDSKEKVWIGNTSGLSYYDKSTGRFIHLPLYQDSSSYSENIHVGKMLEDQQGRFWVATSTGLLLYNRKNHTSNSIEYDKKIEQNKIPITALFQDHSGRIWVGTWGNGFGFINQNTTKIETFKWDNKAALPGTTNIVLSIGETSRTHGRSTLWIGVANGLLKLELPSKTADFDFETLRNTITSDLTYPPFVTNNNATIHTINGNMVNCLYTDNQHILWVGSNLGLNEYLKENQLFKVLPIINGNSINIRKDIFQGKTRFLITSWYGDGLTILDDSLHLLKTFIRFPSNAKNLDNGQISDVLRAKDGLLWIATFHGLYSYDETTGKIGTYLHDAEDSNSITSNKTIALGEDNEGHLWISVYGRGLDRLDLKTKQFTHFEHHENKPNSISDNLIWNIRKDLSGNMEFCTNNGLSIYHRETKKLKNYTEKRSATNTLYGKLVSDVLTDSLGNLWISTDEGLNKLNPKTGQFKLYAHEEGLKDEKIRGMTMDSQHRIWLVSKNSIAVFNPLTETFTNYDDQNGLSVQQLGSIISDEKGGFLIGGNNELIHFKPSDFKSHTSSIPVYITRLETGGIQKIFNRPFEELQHVEMHYPENSFSCSFTAPEFHYGNQVNYSYRLAGVDTDWKNSGKRNFVEYASLKPGTYLFHVRASNGKGIGNNIDTSVLFIVYPPFWQTWWFRLSTIIALILILYLVFSFRIKSIRKKEKLKTETNKQMAEMRLKVLRNRMNPHFMFNALNSIQECILTEKTDSAYRYLSKFSKLVRMILERSDNSFITLSEEIEILELYLQLESLRFEESFSYQIITHDLEIDFISIPPLLIQPFVENALWHGLINKEGEKFLKIDFQADDDTIYVTVEDNGIGRDAARTKKINAIHNQQSLGMQIISDQLNNVDAIHKQRVGFNVEDLLEDHSVEGRPKKPIGTRVTLMLPIIKA